MTTLTVVIPAYNEERGIAQIMQRVLAIKGELKKVNVQELELLVVDDGSKDGTRAAALEVSQKDRCAQVITHPKNKGYGAALKTGFARAKGELIGFLDADGTYPPEYFPQLCKAALEGGELVIGSRMLGAVSQMPLTRRIGNTFFAALLSVLGAQRVSDSASGMRVFQRSIYEQLIPLPDGLNLTPVMSTRAIHEKINVVEIPIPYSERVGRSKLSVFRDGRIFLESIIWTVMYYNPVRILGIIGLVFAFLSALVGLGVLVARLSGITTLGPWGIAALFSALVNAVIGVSLYSLGVLFNYLVSMFQHIRVRQGVFGKPVFKRPLEESFGWMGGLGILGGTILALVAIILGVNGWELGRLWFYLMVSAMSILVGVQLLISWIIVRVLSEVSKREEQSRQDLES
jgi:glycosyltransferase involved in cell wall biosynthesis